MLEVNVHAFFGAVTELRRLNTILENIPSDGRKSALAPEVRDSLAGNISGIEGVLSRAHGRIAALAAKKLHSDLSNKEVSYDLEYVFRALRDIESRFIDEMHFIKLFIINPLEAEGFRPADEILGTECANSIRSAWFDCEEAAKCLALGRPTASVFHSMRMMEVGIRAFAKHLQIPDPVKTSERNWSVALRSIRVKIDEMYPQSQRLSGSKGAFLESLYVHLDAVRNPWRNATMHVESVYTEEDARHISECVKVFIRKMAEHFDEDGNEKVANDDIFQ